MLFKQLKILSLLIRERRLKILYINSQSRRSGCIFVHPCFDTRISEAFLYVLNSINLLSRSKLFCSLNELLFSCNLLRNCSLSSPHVFFILKLCAFLSFVKVQLPFLYRPLNIGICMNVFKHIIMMLLNLFSMSLKSCLDLHLILFSYVMSSR